EGLNHDTWDWKSEGENTRIQTCNIEIKKSLAVKSKLTIILLYYYPYKLDKIEPDSVLNNYFKVSAWSPQSLHYPPSYWRKNRGGEK
ncbi:unnamed protein product, partial [marine sediment metagenome]